MPTWKKVVVSGSAISQLNNDANYLASTGAGIISSSAQLAGDISGSFVATSASIATAIAANLSSINALDDTYATDAQLNAVSASVKTFATDADTTLSSSLATDIATNKADIAALDDTYATDAEVNAVSASVKTFATDADTTLSSSIATDIAGNDTDIAALQTDSGSFSTRIATIEGDNATQTELDAVSSSLVTTIDNLSSTLAISGSTGNDSVNLKNDALSVVGTANEIETTVTDNQIAVGIVTNPTLTGNVTVTGNLEVSGTTTTVDSTTVELGDNILALNGTGAALGGIHVNDGPASGSLLWDGTNDRWIAGASGSEVQVALLEGQGLLSGSAQIAANISGSITSTSASLAADIATNLSSINALGDTYATDAELNASSSALTTAYTAADTTLSSSLATDIATNKADIAALDDTYATDAQLNAVSASVKTFATDADTTLSSSLATDIATNLASITALDDTYATDAQLNAVSASVKTFATDADTTLSSSIATDIAGNDTDIAALQTDSGSFSSRISTIEGDNATQTELDAVSSSIATTINGLSSTLSISGSTGNDTVNLVDDDLSIVGTANAITTTVTDNQIAIDIVDNPTLTGNVTVSGNLEVQGTTTTVDSTTVELGDNILALNGTGAVLGGIHVNDGPASGSLLWDGTNDRWIAGASGSEVQVALLEGQDLLSGSAQIAANISGSFTAPSASFSTRVTSLEDSVGAGGLISSSAQIASDISGSFTSTSASLAADIATNLSSINALDDTYATDAQLNSVSASVKTFATDADTTLSSSLATDIATNKADIAALDNTYATDAEVNAATSSLSASLATDIATNLASIGTLNDKTLISGSTFSSPNQGTVRATINGTNTDVDTGLQQADSPTFAGLTITGDLVVTGDRVEQQVTNLAVEDQFITINSGAAAQDAGFFFEGQGASFGWDESENRFALDFTGGTADQTTITSDAYVAAVALDESDVNYQKDGNIFVSASGEAYIYVS